MDNQNFPDILKYPEIKLIAGDIQFPEGPAFAPDGSLWAVELKANSLLRYSNGLLDRYHVGGAPNGIAIDVKGNIWFCDSENSAVRKFNPATKETETVISNIDGEPLNKPNDLAFDKLENLVFTCPGESRTEPSGYVCVFMKNGAIKKIAAEKYFPNGLAFSTDGKTLVIAETYRHRLWKGEWNMHTGEWINAQPWCDTGGPDGPGGPDGMAFDDYGNLFVAVYGTGEIRVINTEGKIIHAIKIPGPNPTNCAFDPSGKLGLVVTEAGHGYLLSIASNHLKNKLLP